jgi:hypothetical protein
MTFKFWIMRCVEFYMTDENIQSHLVLFLCGVRFSMLG